VNGGRDAKKLEVRNVGEGQWFKVFFDVLHFKERVWGAPKNSNDDQRDVQG